MTAGCAGCRRTGRRCEGCGAWIPLADIDAMGGHARESSDGTAEQCGPVAQCQFCEKVTTAWSEPEPEPLTLEGLLAVVTEWEGERFGQILARADVIEVRTHAACPTGALYALDAAVVDRIMEPQFVGVPKWVAAPPLESRTALVVCHPDHEDVARRVVDEVERRRLEGAAP